MAQHPKVIYLSMSQFPEELRVIPRISWHFVKTIDELQGVLGAGDEEVFVVVRLVTLTRRTFDVFHKWSRNHFKSNFIFLVQHIDDHVQEALRLTSQIMVILEDEQKSAIAKMIQKRVFGVEVEARRELRVAVSAPVIVKKSTFVADESLPGVQLLREGAMQDFSRGGARLNVYGGGVAKKDFVSVMYKDSKGRWVAVDSQVRWVQDLGGGKQAVGVQFLAVSA